MNDRQSSPDPRRLGIEVEIAYEFEAPCDAILQIGAAATTAQQIISERFDFGSVGLISLPAQEAIGLRQIFHAEGLVSGTYEADVSVARAASDVAGLAAHPLPDLPDEAIRYLMPSRYCMPAEFAETTAEIFANLHGGDFIAAVRDWTHEHIRYAPGSSTADTGAVQSFEQREGICRDFAHIVISMARAVGIPARFVACYGPDVTPPDFHAVAEVWLDGGWHLVDATGMAEAGDIVCIGVGLDAAEVSFLTVFGRAELIRQTVKVRRL